MEAVLEPLNSTLTAAHGSYNGLSIRDYNGWRAVSPGPAIATLPAALATYLAALPPSLTSRLWQLLALLYPPH